MGTLLNAIHAAATSQPTLSVTAKDPLRWAGAMEPREWAKLRKMLLRQMDKFIDLFPLVLRNEDLTAVDRMRITCRKLEQILDLVYLKPRPRHIRKLRHRLKLCRRTLGRLRDCDALLALTEQSITAGKPDSDAWSLLREHLLSLRTRAAHVTLDKLSRINLAMPYLRVKRDFDLLPARKNGSIPSIVRGPGTVYKRIQRSLNVRWATFAAAVERSHNDPCEHVIHRMRIAAKRLRYLTEVMAKLHVEGSMEALAWLKSLQKTVGDWHDLEIMERLLRNLIAHRRYYHVKPLTDIHIRHLIRSNRDIKKKSAEEFFTMTRRSRDYQEVKKWVAETLARKAVTESHSV